VNDLNELLERAAGPATGRVDAHADLTRGQRALSRTRVRRGAAGLVGVAAVGVLGVGLATRGGSGSTPVADDPTPSATPSPTAGPTPSHEPTTDPETTPGLAVDQPPAGWVEQGADVATITFARPGDTTPHYDFEHKIVVMLGTDAPPGASQGTADAPYWVSHDSGYLHVTTACRPARPHCFETLQLPKDAMTLPDALAFLSGVRVLDAAQPVGG
jgi:hypothetical protein